MSCNYCWNQPKKYERYDLYLDGKLTANEVIYKTVSKSGKKENVNLDTKIKEIEERLKVHFTFQTVENLPDVGDETVIYLKRNDETSADPDAIDTYNEYMWVKDKNAYELIGSGSYEKQQADLKAEEERAKAEEERIEKKLIQEIEDRKADVDAEEKRAIKTENELSTYIKEEVELRTSQINGINQEAKENRIRIEQLESTVSTEITRATKAEDELSARIETIEFYDIDNRVKQLEIDLPDEKERAAGEEKRIKDKLAQEIEDRIASESAMSVVILELQEKINQLEETIKDLKSYHDNEPTEPEQGEGGYEPETPTE